MNIVSWSSTINGVGNNIKWPFKLLGCYLFAIAEAWETASNAKVAAYYSTWNAKFEALKMLYSITDGEL